MAADHGGALWATVKRALDPYGVLVRIESPMTGGIPDVAYCLGGVAGWIELKYLSAWPLRATSPIVLPKLTSAQVEFINRWEKRGRGRAWVLLQVASDYALLNPSITSSVYRREMNAEELRADATLFSAGMFAAVPFARALMGRDVPSTR